MYTQWLILSHTHTHTHTHTPSAQTMVDLGKDKQEADKFVRAMNEHLGEFQFPEQFYHGRVDCYRDCQSITSILAVCQQSFILPSTMNILLFSISLCIVSVMQVYWVWERGMQSVNNTNLLKFNWVVIMQIVR